MHARKGAAARLSRVGIVALALGVGTFAVLTMEIRSRATAQLSKEQEISRGMRELSIDTLSPPSTQEFV